MNDEYLWSKKGSDPEVQQLEELLHEFRFTRSTPPELPATSVVTLASVPKRRFAWVFAIAAPATAALIAAFWFAMPATTDVTVTTIERAPVSTRTEFGNDSIAHHKVPDGLNERLPTLETRFDASPRTLNRRSRRPNKPVVASQKAKLTREEKYAYDRLMLALSIAGSKLKIVQDTLDRTTETDPKIIRNDK